MTGQGETGTPAATWRVGVLGHGRAGDGRVCLTPADAAALIERGHAVAVSPSLSGEGALSSERYRDSGAEIAESDEAVLAADLLLALHPLSAGVVASLTDRQIVVGFLAPFERPDLIAALADRGVTAVALELVPRTTIAQPMDALSSQASLAGYAAVALAASRLPKALPMMSTAAGTIRPAKVLVLGAGVAGLQAIATAQRLGARVTAFDVRDTAAEQVRSLGARFAPLPGTADAETEGGYAKASSEVELARQRDHLKGLCAESDIVVSTAQVFGRRAPTLVTAEMIDAMKPGSVVVDAAAATGGNVEVSRPDEEVVRNGVTILADTVLAARVAADASQVLSANITALLNRIVDPATGRVKAEGEDEIADAVAVVRGGRITDDRVAARVAEHQAGDGTGNGTEASP